MSSLREMRFLFWQIDFLKCNPLCGSSPAHKVQGPMADHGKSLTNAYLSLMNKSPALKTVFKLTFAVSVLIRRGFSSSGMSFPREFC